MNFLYKLYQFFIFLPTWFVVTIIAALFTIIGCVLGNAHFWGYYPGKVWSWLTCRMLLLPIRIEGRENIDKHRSYVFVANHQGPMDIFLIYGFLGRNFKWMMKHQLRKMPFVGYACEKSHQIFVDKRGPSKVKQTYDKARHTLKDGMSLVVFPEGSRTFTGHMGVFKRGAFMLADELQLPIVPLTINGSFDVLPRDNKWLWVKWHPLTLTIHAPIYPESQGAEDINKRMDESYRTIMSAITPEYQGFKENPDQ